MIVGIIKMYVKAVVEYFIIYLCTCAQLWWGRHLRSPMDCKEIRPVNERNQPWIFTGRTDAEAEAPKLWPPDVKSWLIRKDSDAGKNQRQKETKAAEDEMIRHQHWLNGHEFANSERQWKTEAPGMLQSLESQIVGHDLATEQQQAQFMCGVLII